MSFSTAGGNSTFVPGMAETPRLSLRERLRRKFRKAGVKAVDAPLVGGPAQQVCSTTSGASYGRTETPEQYAFQFQGPRSGRTRTVWTKSDLPKSILQSGAYQEIHATEREKRAKESQTHKTIKHQGQRVASQEDVEKIHNRLQDVDFDVLRHYAHGLDIKGKSRQQIADKVRALLLLKATEKAAKKGKEKPAEDAKGMQTGGKEDANSSIATTDIMGRIKAGETVSASLPDGRKVTLKPGKAYHDQPGVAVIGPDGKQIGGVLPLNRTGMDKWVASLKAEPTGKAPSSVAKLKDKLASGLAAQQAKADPANVAAKLKEIGERLKGAREKKAEASKPVASMSPQELKSAMDAAPANKFMTSHEVDWGNLRGQGKRSGYMVKGGMRDSSLQGKKSYTSMFGKLPKEEGNEAESLNGRGKIAYAKARAVGMDHDSAMMFGYRADGDESVDPYKYFSEKHKNGSTGDAQPTAQKDLSSPQKPLSPDPKQAAKERRAAISARRKEVNESRKKSLEALKAKMRGAKTQPRAAGAPEPQRTAEAAPPRAPTSPFAGDPSKGARNLPLEAVKTPATPFHEAWLAKEVSQKTTDELRKYAQDQHDKLASATTESAKTRIINSIDAAKRELNQRAGAAKAKQPHEMTADEFERSKQGDTYGDWYFTPEGKYVQMRGSGGMGSNRVGAIDINGKHVGYFNRDQLHLANKSPRSTESTRAADKWLEGVSGKVGDLKSKHESLLLGKKITEQFRQSLASGKMTQQQFDAAKSKGTILSDADYAKAQGIEKQIQEARDTPLTVPENKEHRKAVESALASGKTVPPEVLKDYPDLAKSTPTAPPVDSTKAYIDAIKRGDQEGARKILLEGAKENEKRRNQERQEAGAKQPQITPASTSARVTDARNGKKLVHVPSGGDFKTDAHRLAESLGGVWSKKEKAYVMSPSKAARFQQLQAEGKSDAKAEVSAETAAKFPAPERKPKQVKPEHHSVMPVYEAENEHNNNVAALKAAEAKYDVGSVGILDPLRSAARKSEAKLKAAKQKLAASIGLDEYASRLIDNPNGMSPQEYHASLKKWKENFGGAPSASPAPSAPRVSKLPALQRLIEAARLKSPKTTAAFVPPVRKAKEPAAPAMHPMAAQQVAEYAPIMARQVGNESAVPRKQWMAASNVIDGLNPQAQRALLAQLRQSHPEAFAYGEANARPNMKGLFTSDAPKLRNAHLPASAMQAAPSLSVPPKPGQTTIPSPVTPSRPEAINDQFSADASDPGIGFAGAIKKHFGDRIVGGDKEGIFVKTKYGGPLANWIKTNRAGHWDGQRGVWKVKHNAEAALVRHLRMHPQHYERGGREDYDKGPHKFASTQFNIPASMAAKIKAAAAKIGDDVLAGDGRESEPHVTVKYGLHDDDPVKVSRNVDGREPVTIAFGKTSIFPAKEASSQRGGEKYDVVKIDIESPGLHALNEQVAKLPHTDTHPEYKPHVTLAYVKAGHGKRFAGQSIPGVTGAKVKLSHLVFSARDGKRTTIKLDGTHTSPTQHYSRVEKPMTVGQKLRELLRA